MPAVMAFEKAPQITTQFRPSPPGTLSPENRVFTCKSLGESVKWLSFLQTTLD